MGDHPGRSRIWYGIYKGKGMATLGDEVQYIKGWFPVDHLKGSDTFGKVISTVT